MKYESGQRVKIIPHGMWPVGGTGMVSYPPEYVSEYVDGKIVCEATQRTVRALGGIITNVWVEFDCPMQDSERDGLYIAGEIRIEYLQHMKDDLFG